MNTKRLIAPVTTGWNEGEHDWSFVKDATADIARWERETGHKVPDDYRRFMLRFNGGRVYPRLFRYTVPLERYPSNEPVTMIESFYSWTDGQEYLRGEMYGRGTPPDMLFIGGDPGGLEVLLSLRPSDWGQVFCWPHTTNIWGIEGNSEIWHQADSFEAFIDSLFDGSDRSDYSAWHVPIYDKLARPLAF